MCLIPALSKCFFSFVLRGFGKTRTCRTKIIQFQCTHIFWVEIVGGGGTECRPLPKPTMLEISLSENFQSAKICTHHGWVRSGNTHLCYPPPPPVHSDKNNVNLLCDAFQGQTNSREGKLYYIRSPETPLKLSPVPSTSSFSLSVSSKSSPAMKSR